MTSKRRLPRRIASAAALARRVVACSRLASRCSPWLCREASVLIGWMQHTRLYATPCRCCCPVTAHAAAVEGACMKRRLPRHGHVTHLRQNSGQSAKCPQPPPGDQARAPRSLPRWAGCTGVARRGAGADPRPSGAPLAAVRAPHCRRASHATLVSHGARSAAAAATRAERARRCSPGRCEARSWAPLGMCMSQRRKVVGVRVGYKHAASSPLLGR